MRHEAVPQLARSPPLAGDPPLPRAAEGCAVRIAIGDPDSENVRLRGEEEKFGHRIESCCRPALMHYRSLIGTPGIEVRAHGTTLYNSLYRADDQVMVNARVWRGEPLAAPVWHLWRSGIGGMFDNHIASFDAVWATATPVEED